MNLRSPLLSLPAELCIAHVTYAGCEVSKAFATDRIQSCKPYLLSPCTPTACTGNSAENAWLIFLYKPAATISSRKILSASLTIRSWVSFTAPRIRMARPGLWPFRDQHVRESVYHLRTQERGDENFSRSAFPFGSEWTRKWWAGNSYTRCSGIPIFVPRSRTCPDVSLLVDVWILVVVTLVFE